MTTTPRIRNELSATPAEDQGIRYFDVSDPRSGARMRMYDFEWLLAQKMDGRRGFDELARFASNELGISPSTDDLEDYADKLRSLGFFEHEDNDLTPLPQPLPADERADDIPVEEDAPVILSQQPVPQAQRPTAQMPTVAPAAETPPPARVSSPPILQQAPPRVSTPPSSSTDRLPSMPPEEPRKSGGGGLFVLVLLLLGGGGALGYFKFFAPPQAQKVTVALASPHEVMQFYDGSAPVKKSDAQTLSFGEAGKVSSVVDKGATVQPDQQVAKLEAYDKIEKDLVDVKDRLGFYEKQLAAAKAKNDEAAAKAAEAKVAEKQKLLTDSQAKAAKARLTAPASGTVTDVMVKVGDDVKAGAAAVKIADNRMTVEFKLKADEAAAIKPTSPMTLQPAAGGATIAGRFARLDGDTGVVVELADDAAAVKVGDSLRLVKAKVPNVVPVPLAAVVKKDGADVVFVMSEGEARAHKVTIVDRTATEALVSTGLSAGDSIITSGADALTDGQKVSTQ